MSIRNHRLKFILKNVYYFAFYKKCTREYTKQWIKEKHFKKYWITCLF